MMNRSTAIERINDGLGFMSSGNAMEPKIILRLKEAQRDLEKGKTLPKFLIEEDSPLTLLTGEHSVAKPSDFLRVDDEVQIHYIPDGYEVPIFLRKRFYNDAVAANIREQNDPVAPSIYVLRQSTIDFVTTADTDYTLYWNYYKAAEVLDTDIENAWLEHAPEWLIGEAGLRIASDARDAEAVALFGEMLKRARAAHFANLLDEELSGGPLQMGANL